MVGKFYLTLQLLRKVRVHSVRRSKIETPKNDVALLDFRALAIFQARLERSQETKFRKDSEIMSFRASRGTNTLPNCKKRPRIEQYEDAQFSYLEKLYKSTLGCGFYECYYKICVQALAFFRIE